MKALVTGAARRLGRAMALALAEDGHDLALHYSGSAQDARRTAAEIEAMGRRVALVQADLLDPGETERVVPEAAEGLGGALTVLVNNASIFEYDNIATITGESWERAMGSNLRAPVFLTQAFAAQAPAAITDANGEPRASALVVNMIDQRVRKLTPEFMSYTLAKAALWAFTKTAAQGLAPRIRVNAIGPGPTLRGGRQSPEHFARQRAATILGRGAEEADITAALRYFLTTPAVTGQLLCVDGGQHLAWETPDVLGTE